LQLFSTIRKKFLNIIFFIVMKQTST